MTDKENTTTAMGGKETSVSGAVQTGTAATRGKPARTAGRSVARTRGVVSMLCIPARDGANHSPHDNSAVAKVVITRDPRKPIYVCWEEKDGANLSVAIEAEGKE